MFFPEGPLSMFHQPLVQKYYSFFIIIIQMNFCHNLNINSKYDVNQLFEIFRQLSKF